jgi:hypothetical protein
MAGSSGMQQAAVWTVAELPREAAWARLKDFSLAHNYVPRPTRTEIVSEQGQHEDFPGVLGFTPGVHDEGVVDRHAGNAVYRRRP